HIVPSFQSSTVYPVTELVSIHGATSFAHGTLGLSPTHRDPIIRAVSFLDNSSNSRSSIALRFLGVKLAIAADRIRRRSPCKKAVSGPAGESGIFNRSAVYLFPRKSWIGTSRRPRPLRNHIRASCVHRNHGRPRPNAFTGRARNSLPPSLLTENA